MHARSVAGIDHAVAVGEAEVPGAAGCHVDAGAVETEIDLAIGGHGYVQPGNAPFGGEIMVAMFLDRRSRRQAHQADGLERAAERRKHGAEIAADFEQFGVFPIGLIGFGRDTQDRVQHPGGRTQRQDAPVAIVILRYEMCCPFNGIKQFQIGAQ